jgi:hypothetical protein
MKKLIVFVMAFLFVFSVFGERYDRETQEVLDYLEENGIEYEVMLKDAVKELPKGAKVLSIEGVEEAVRNFAEEEGNSVRFNLIESWAYARTENPEYRRLVLAGGNDLGGDGYLYKWERNTTNNQSSPGWTSATKGYACPGGTSSTIVNYCDQTDPNIREIAYEITGYSNDYNEYTACNKCYYNNVVSFLFSVKTYVIFYQRVYIQGFGWVWMPYRIYSQNWVSTLTSGTYSFNPVWDLCNTDLENFCDWLGY